MKLTIAGGVNARIEHGHRDARANRALNRSRERSFVGSRYRQAIDMLRNHRIDDLDLSRVIRFFVGPVPQGLHTELARGRVDTGVDRNKKQVRCRFGNNSNNLLARAPARDKPRQ